MEGGIPVFDGEGYEIWSKKMKTLFLSLELWDLVEQGYECKGLGMTRLAELRKKDSKALYLIQQGVSNNIFDVIMEADTSNKAWNAIGLIFDQIHNQKEQIHDQKEQIEIDIPERKRGQSTETHDHEKCIFRVPQELRKGNEEFYEPQVLAIGPYFRGKTHLDSMEEVKNRYMKQLIDRKGEQNQDRYVGEVSKHLERVEKCYGKTKSNSKEGKELAEMMVLDGCFIIELMYQKVHPKGGDPIFDPVINTSKFIALQTDMLLIENQIPFFILQILFDMIHPPDPRTEYDTLISITLKFFKERIMKYYSEKFFSTRICRLIRKENVHHLLHIIHEYVGLGFSQNISTPFGQFVEAARLNRLLSKPNRFVSWDFKRSSPRSETLINPFFYPATKLEKANVRLKRSSYTVSIFDISFKGGELKIPRWSIDNLSEIELQNLIAFEVCQAIPHERFFIDYLFFMDHLIDSSDDVNLLIKHGILINQMIDAKSVDTMLRKLTKKVNSPNPYTYYEITTDLREYCELSWNKWIVNLKEKHFKNPWTIISLIAGFFLLSLTAIQTIFTIKNK